MVLVYTDDYNEWKEQNLDLEDKFELNYKYTMWQGAMGFYQKNQMEL